MSTRSAWMLAALLALLASGVARADEAPGLKVGVAVADITPPVGFPMAGYYRERLAEDTLDPLQAKAIVFRDGNNAAALLVCDLIGIAHDLSREIRRRASEATGIPPEHIIVSGTHTHTAPDYTKALYLHLGGEAQEELRAEYIDRLLAGTVDAIVRAYAEARPATLSAGSAQQTVPVAFNRRFVMKDGSVKTWQKLANPNVVRAAGPIDPEVGLLVVRDEASSAPRTILSNFALHLDTVGGTRWSADYPFFIEQSLRKEFGPELVSVFATGCCGDINHADPTRDERNTAAFIGGALGDTIRDGVGSLKPIDNPGLTVQSTIVELPLGDAEPGEVERSVQLVELARSGGKVEFFEHVTAYKKLILDQFRHKQPHAVTAQHISWGLSRSWAGVGESLPVDVTVLTLGSDVAIVCLPGEVFVELGLAIKQASPYRTTLVVELSNAVETIYVPHRAAYAGGSYEVTNSTLQPGSGEMLVEAALTLLRKAASSSVTK